MLPRVDFRQVGEGAFVALDLAHYESTVVKYDPTTANQTIVRDWEDALLAEPAPEMQDERGVLKATPLGEIG